MKELMVRDEVKAHNHDWQLYLQNFIRTQNGKAYKTIKAYRGGILSFFRYMDLKVIDKPLPDDLHDYHGLLVEQHKSIFTIGLYMIALKLFFAYLAKPYGSGAESVQVYPDIYTMAAPKPQRPQRKKHYRDRPTDEEVSGLRTLLEPTDGQKAHRDLLMIDLCLYCGLRVNEVANVSLADIVKDKETYRLFVLRKGKTRKNNFVWVDPDLASRLLRYARQYKFKGYVFTDISHLQSGGHISSSTVSTIIGRHMKRAQIKRPNITAHSLRHYAGTRFYTETHDIYATQQFLGHSNSETTEIYMHVDDSYEKMSFALTPVSS